MRRCKERETDMMAHHDSTPRRPQRRDKERGIEKPLALIFAFQGRRVCLRKSRTNFSSTPRSIESTDAEEFNCKGKLQRYIVTHSTF